jgi:hypothetical protein
MAHLRRFFSSASYRVSLFLLASALSSGLHAQPRQMTLGHSVVPLDGLWKFHIGDDPHWVNPDFDDSAWPTMDMTPPPGSMDPGFGTPGFLPGWTSRGYAGHSGYAWYRLRTQVNGAEGALSLKMPEDVDDAYQVYVNGRSIGDFGDFTARGVTVYGTQPRAFALPATVGNGPMTIAIRMWMKPDTILESPDSGGMHAPPMLGEASAIASMLRLDWDDVLRSYGGRFLEMAAEMQGLLVCFWLWWLDRQEPAYPWLGLACMTALCAAVATVLGEYGTWFSLSTSFLLQDVVLAPLQIGFWIIFWAYWFRIPRIALLQRAVWSLALLLAIGVALQRSPLYGWLVPMQAATWLLPLTTGLKLLLGGLLVWVTYQGIYRNRAEGLLALPAVLLVAVALYQVELSVLHVPIQISVWGYDITLRTFAILISLLIITILLLRRFVDGQRERQRVRQEIEQARQVQQVLIPESIPAIAGFTIEHEYRPAQSVGGDFFQILPGDDGSVLAVLGDVSGKGLTAAMLVSLLVGAIRMVCEITREPMAILEALNRRLCGRLQMQFVTCVVLHITPDGEAVAAVAGHLPPYLNGREIELKGSLPLGITESAVFEQVRLELEPDDRLTLLTDGVIEAQSEKRELFGSARTQALVEQQGSAAKIADAAQNYGQEDDITVLAVSFQPVANGTRAVAPSRITA